MEDLSDLKRVVHAHCLAVLAGRIRNAEAGVEDAKESGRSDTKSSAGDKHETGRAMAQLELEKRQAVLGHLLDLAYALDGMDPDRQCLRIERGALFRTELGLFIVAAALGRVHAAGLDIMVISTGSPLFLALASMTVGGSREFKGTAYRLTAIA
jgi:hypothetical protein